MTAASTNQPRIGRIRRGWEITKSSWRVLRLDKELAAIPLISALVSVIVLIPFAVLAIFGSAYLDPNMTANAESSSSSWQGLIFAFIVGLVLTIVANFFSGALIHGAMQRFNNQDPTIRSSLAGARKKFRPLLGFSFIMATVGFILQLAEERLPIAGRISAYLFDAAWNIANVFAIPVIMMNEDAISPLQATKQSVKTIKKVWGEGIVVSAGIGAIGALVTLAYVIVLFLMTAGVTFGLYKFAGITPSVYLGILVILLLVLGITLISIVMSALNAIAKTALYVYATTGEAPSSFKREVLEASVTQKKARKIFA